MKDRLLYIDALKGAAILFVVFYHILWSGVKFKTSPTVALFDTTCMQLFFFVSGYLSYRSNGEINVSQVQKMVIKKILNLLIPSICMFLFSIWFFSLDIYHWLQIDFKNGYWFTYVLFFIFLIHYIYRLLSKNSCLFADYLVLTLSFLVSLCSISTYKILDFEWAHIISLQLVLKYYFFFFFGYLMNKDSGKFDRLFCSQLAVFVFLLISLIPIHSLEPGRISYLITVIVSLSRVIVIFRFFYNSNYISKRGILVDNLCKFGKHSMDIYFLHYYFIFGMPTILEFLNSQNDLYVVRGPGATFTIELLIILPLSIFISYLCIAIRTFLNQSTFLSRLFLGPLN